MSVHDDDDERQLRRNSMYNSPSSRAAREAPGPATAMQNLEGAQAKEKAELGQNLKQGREEVHPDRRDPAHIAQVKRHGEERARLHQEQAGERNAMAARHRTARSALRKSEQKK